MTLPQPIPRNPDGSFVDETWAEGGVVIEPGSARKGTGWVDTDPVTEGERNWLDREPARYMRVCQAEYMRATQGLVSSWLVSNGIWSDTGVINPLEGFLSDGAGLATATADVWVDGDGKGATGLQVQVSLATPQLFIALSDTYVYLDTSAALAGLGGGMTFVAVPNGNPPPATPASTVLFWVVVTDAANITGQSVVVPDFPTFKRIAFEEIRAVDIYASGLLEVMGDTNLEGGVILGTTGADVVTVLGTMTCAEVLTCTSGAQGPAASSLVLPQGGTIAASKTLVGDASTSVTAGNMFSLAAVEAGTGFQGTGGSVATLPQGAIISANKSLTLGTDTPSLVGETAKSAEGDALYHNGDNVQAPGIAISTQQSANTGAAATVTTLTTTTRQDAPVSLYVTVEGYFSRSVVGNLTLTIQEDDGAFTYSTLVSTFVTPLVGLAFEYHRFTRLRTADATTRLFRLVAATGDAALVDIKEALITVYPAGG